MTELADNLIILTFYVAALVTVVATVLMISRTNAVHALLYLILSSLSMAIIFYLYGAPLAAALEIIIYAGAVMILFVFVVMMLNLGSAGIAQEQQWLAPGIWRIPAVMAALLLLMLVQLIQSQPETGGANHLIPVSEVGILLYGPYLLVVELASFLLLAGLIGAYHLARSTGFGRHTTEDRGDSPS